MSFVTNFNLYTPLKKRHWYKMNDNGASRDVVNRLLASDSRIFNSPIHGVHQGEDLSPNILCIFIKQLIKYFVWRKSTCFFWQDRWQLRINMCYENRDKFSWNLNCLHITIRFYYLQINKNFLSQEHYVSVSQLNHNYNPERRYLIVVSYYSTNLIY